VFGKSLFRSTWRISTPEGEEIAIAQERSPVLAIARRLIDFVPDIGGLIPIPYNFDILAGGQLTGKMDRKFQLRDRYVLDLSGAPKRCSTGAWRSPSRSAWTRCRTASPFGPVHSVAAI
jgi:hypothetical protein